MINHARTLLLNRSRADLSGAWAQYVDPEFTRRTLPAYLASVWRVLFGGNPDKEMLNWRASQYMQILHSTDFFPYIYALDSRVSYKLPTTISDAELPYAVVVATDTTPGISLLGTPRDDPANGRLMRSFTVSVETDLSTALVRDNFSGSVAVAGIDVDNGIPLGQSGLSLLLYDVPSTDMFFYWLGADDFDQLTPEQFSALQGDEGSKRWLIESVATPSKLLVDIMDDLKRIPTSQLDQIFGAATTEPFKTFRKLWYNDRGFAHKLSGLLLAWIYRREQMLNG